MKYSGLNTYKSTAGFRHILSHNTDGFHYNPCPTDQSLNPNIKDNLYTLKTYDQVFECQAYPKQILNMLDAIVASNVTCVIEHLALPYWLSTTETSKNAAKEAWLTLLQQCQPHPNIFIKLSGLSMFGDIEQIKPAVMPCLEYLGAERCLFGSNHPVSYTDDYNYWYNQLRPLISSDAAQKMIFYDNAFKVYHNTP